MTSTILDSPEALYPFIGLKVTINHISPNLQSVSCQEYGSVFPSVFWNLPFSLWSHVLCDPMSCDSMFFTCDSGHPVYKVLIQYLVSLRVCSGPQQTRYFASYPCLAETSTQTCPRWLLVNQPKSSTSWGIVATLRNSCTPATDTAVVLLICVGTNLCWVGRSRAWGHHGLQRRPLADEYSRLVGGRQVDRLGQPGCSERGNWNGGVEARVKGHTSGRCTSEYSPSVLSARHGGGTLSHSVFGGVHQFIFRLFICEISSTPGMASVLSRPTIEGVCWIALAFVFVTRFTERGCVRNMVLFSWVSSGIFHLVRDPVSCDSMFFTCDGGHPVYKVLIRYLVSLHVCSGPQQTRYFASYPCLMETSTFPLSPFHSHTAAL